MPVLERERPIFTTRKEQKGIHFRTRDLMPDSTAYVILYLFGAAMIVLLLLIGTARAESLPYTLYVCTQTDPLNVRERPSIHAEIVARIERGEAVTVIEVKDGWALVVGVGEGGRGWASVKYLADRPPELPDDFLDVEAD